MQTSRRHSPLPTHRPSVLLLALLSLVLGAAGPTPVASSPRAPATETKFYFPLVSRTLPPQVVDIITNESFENENWFTDYAHGGNQWPFGWTFYSPNTGQLMPFPTKTQGGQTVAAISGGFGEYVHKYQWQLPPDEYLGAYRGLILDGQLTYKAFSDHIPNALVLSQTLHYTPGHSVSVTGYILGETNVSTCSSNGVLENDHFVASMQLGAIADTRLYVQMKDEHAVAGNERAWNKFVVTDTFPANGELLFKFTVQSNWGCEVNFFIDNFSAVDPMP